MAIRVATFCIAMMDAPTGATPATAAAAATATPMDEDTAAAKVAPHRIAEVPQQLRQKVMCMISTRLRSATSAESHVDGDLEALAADLEHAIHVETVLSSGGRTSSELQLRSYKATSRSVASKHYLCARLEPNGACAPSGGASGGSTDMSVVAALISGRTSAACVVAAHLGSRSSGGGSAAAAAASEQDGALILHINEMVPKLFCAAVGGKCEEVITLLDASEGRAEQIRLLNFPYPHQGGKTPLHGAAMHGHVELLKMLVERGSVVNARDRFSGATPLHSAAAAGHADAITALLEAGGDPAATNSQGQTPRDVCLAAMSALVSEHLASARVSAQTEGKGSAGTRLSIAVHSRNAGRRAQRFARCEDRFDAFTELCESRLLYQYQLLSWAVGCHSVVTGGATDTAGAAKWSVSQVSSDLLEMVTAALRTVELPERPAVQRDAAERARAAVRAEESAKRQRKM